MTSSRARQVLRDVFGYPEFRGAQAEIIGEILAGHDALVLMPTGGGKSLCYQIPSLIRPGTGIVISPLIALMQDQVDALAQVGVRAARLNSSLSAAEARAVERQLIDGELDLLYLAPERLTQERTLDLLARSELALFAIDEAHCVSQWGHDFRADYLALDILGQRFPGVPRIALTATADELTRREIVVRLGLDGARLFVSSFDRPNIQYRIALKSEPRQQLWRFLQDEHSGHSGIVYAMTRRKVEDTAAWLVRQGVDAVPYHAGLDAEVRRRHQERFAREDGVVVVATIAFGMGIDKPDLRFVAHLDLPKSVEAYYQETGRAGRDGLPATAWMVYGLQDVILLRQLIEKSQADESFKRVERHKLDALLGLCELTTCRRHALLDYFGERAPQRCSNCDTCLQPVDTWDATEAAQKALSCVLRTGQRFGVQHLIDVLIGRPGDKVQRHGHDRIRTFGVGRDLDEKQWRSVYRQLIARGLLRVDVEGFGALLFEKDARPVLAGDDPVLLRRDLAEPARRSRRSRRAPEAASGPEDASLWDSLRALRRALASTQGVPPYVIFHDRTLHELAQRKPASLDEMLEISGVGQAKLRRYGQVFLDAIREHVGE
ncbi:MAG: DNA helicase RecQ [Pseudomonadota bacterium]